MLKYKVGDKVRIVSERTKDVPWNSSGLMDKYLGTVMTIVEARRDSYYMLEDRGDPHGHWTWCDEMIEGLFIEPRYIEDEL